MTETAMRWDGTRASIKACCRWVNGHMAADDEEPILSYTFQGHDDVHDVLLWTPEGIEELRPGDLIIRGDDCEFRIDCFRPPQEPYTTLD